MEENNRLEKATETAEFLDKKTGFRPEIFIVLGSGLGGFGERVKNKKALDYGEIPNLKLSTVSGHQGKLIYGEVAGKKVYVMQGRIHYYEGYSLFDVSFMARVMGLQKIPKMIVTNAGGASNKAYKPGDLMLIKDHINLMGTNTLIGPHFTEFGERFPDMSEAYSLELRSLAKKTAKRLKITLKEGVYMALSGPSYETPAEVRMLRKLGADVVGMSTVPEVIVANQMGMKILGISLVTNMAAGILKQKLDHKEVIKAGKDAAAKFEILVETIIAGMA